jgi:crotonobetainyl-CoA:carnitine CoA-transferase CaiB-like acyl-CoA transferase
LEVRFLFGSGCVLIERRIKVVSALGNIKVLDVTGIGPACVAAMMLGDMGAEVLKIDMPPGSGRRGVGDGIPFFQKTGEEAERIDAYVAMNRNKKSLALNFRTEAGQQIFHELASRYDVIIESFRPGVMDRMNVGYQAISRINPRIIYCSVSGYGQTGPYRNLPGHDANYTGMGGVLSLIGERQDAPPVCALNIAADVAVAILQSAIGIMFALWARERTGRGQHVDISMTDGVTWLLHGIPGATTYLRTGELPRRGETITSGTRPYYTIYKAKDGKYLTICAIEPQFWQNMCRALGREDLIPGQFEPSPKKEDLLSQLRQIFLTKSRDEWFDCLAKADVPVGKVLDPDELLFDPQVIHRQMVIEKEHPRFGKVRQIGISIKLSDTPGEVRTLTSRLGQHTEEVLSGLGHSQSEIDELKRQGVVY